MSKFSKTRMHATKLVGAAFSGANFSDAQLFSCKCDGTNFSGANFGNSTLQRARCRGANFWQSNLVETSIQETDFAGVRADGMVLDEDDKNFVNFSFLDSLSARLIDLVPAGEVIDSDTAQAIVDVTKQELYNGKGPNTYDEKMLVSIYARLKKRGAINVDTSLTDSHGA